MAVTFEKRSFFHLEGDAQREQAAFWPIDADRCEWPFPFRNLPDLPDKGWGFCYDRVPALAVIHTLDSSC
jgi:hypothetical protein